MPVGQAVTATMRAAGRGRRPAPARRATGRRGGGRGGRLDRGRGGRGAARTTTALTSSTISSGLVALRRPSVKLLLHQRAGELGEHLEVGGVAAGRGGDQERQVGRAVLGAEVGAGESRANASVGTSTCSVRQCGIAMPPGRPVADVASRARASSARPVGVAGAPGVGHLRGQRPDHLGLVTAQRHVQADERRE